MSKFLTPFILGLFPFFSLLMTASGTEIITKQVKINACSIQKPHPALKITEYNDVWDDISATRCRIDNDKVILNENLSLTFVLNCPSGYRIISTGYGTSMSKTVENIRIEGSIAAVTRGTDYFMQSIKIGNRLTEDEFMWNIIAYCRKNGP